MSNQVRVNAEKDPTYAPYCLRCRTMERMKIVERFLWRCACGNTCDERKEKLRCDDCGVEWDDDEVGAEGFWSHCCVVESRTDV